MFCLAETDLVAAVATYRLLAVYYAVALCAARVCCLSFPEMLPLPSRTLPPPPRFSTCSFLSSNNIYRTYFYLFATFPVTFLWYATHFCTMFALSHEIIISAVVARYTAKQSVEVASNATGLPKNFVHDNTVKYNHLNIYILKYHIYFRNP